MEEYSINRKRIYSNFQRKNKWLGLIDYKTLSLIGIYISIIVLILSKLQLGLDYKLYIFAFFSLPVVAMFICSDIEQDSVFDMFIIILKFFMLRCIYTKEKIGKEKQQFYIAHKI